MYRITNININIKMYYNTSSKKVQKLIIVINDSYLYLRVKIAAAKITRFENMLHSYIKLGYY